MIGKLFGWLMAKPQIEPVKEVKTPVNPQITDSVTQVVTDPKPAAEIAKAVVKNTTAKKKPTRPKTSKSSDAKKKK